MKFFNFFNKGKVSQGLPNKGRFGTFFFGSGPINITERTAMEVSAYHRGVMYISTQVAKLPWLVKDKNNEELYPHSVYTLLNLSPNPETTSIMLKLYLIQSALNHGNGWAEIERDISGRPVALWPLRPQSVTPYRTSEGGLIYEVSGGDGKLVYLQPKDLFIVRNAHTLDGIHGLGLIEYAATTLSISKGADTFANGLFSNGGMPSGIIKHPKQLSDEAFNRLKKSWKEQVGGRKTGSTAILEEGAEYTPVSHSPDVMQFLESRKFGVLEIARFLGLPPTKLFDGDAATFNNIEHANLEVATDTLDSWARMLESEADVKLLNNSYGGVYTELDLYAVFRGDMATRSAYFKNMMSVGAITPNQIREREGMAKYTGGDEYYIATNNLTPVSRMKEVIDAQIKKGLPSPAPKEENGEKELNEAMAKYIERKSR